MSSNHMNGLHDANDLLKGAQMFVQDLLDDRGAVPMADLEKDLLEHRPVTTFLQTNLVSVDGSVMGTVKDPNLVNPWGMSDTAGGSPIWISQNGVGLASLYSVAHDATTGADTVTPNAARAPVKILTAGGDPSTPTGQVFNPFASVGAFKVAFPDGTDAPATFMFATQDGTITGWNPGPAAAPHTQAVVAVSTPGADYTGLAIDKAGDTPMLYAANFSQGEVDVFDANFNQINTITDHHGSSDLAPFNAQVLTVQGVERLFVTFASKDAVAQGGMSGDEHGGGFVDEFDLQGNLIQRIDSHGTLNNPWGLAIAPSSFGSFAGDLLVGNHGDGTISVFDLNAHDHQSLGHLLDGAGKAITIPDLFGLIPGETAPAGVTNNGGSPDTIYFTAGGAQALFGSLTPNTTPLQVGMMGPGGH
jgi:uncharacterized protein (TIGR03118 family)